MKKLRDEYVIKAISEQMGRYQEYLNEQELQFVTALSIGDKNQKQITIMKDYTDLEVLKYLASGAIVEICSIDLSRQTVFFENDVAAIKLINCKLQDTQIIVENHSENYAGYDLDIDSCKFEKLTLSSTAKMAKSIHITGRTQYVVSKEKDYQMLESEMLKINPDYLELKEEEKFQILRDNGYINAVAPEIKLYNIDDMEYLNSLIIENACIADLELTNTDKYSVNPKTLETLSFLNSEFKNCHSTFVLKTQNLNIENCKVYIEDVLSNFYGINNLKVINTNSIKFRYLNVLEKINNLHIEKCEILLEDEDLKQISKTENMTLLNVNNLKLDFKKLLKFKSLKTLTLSENVDITDKVMKKLQKKVNIVIQK